MENSGINVLITGASSGIGEALSLYYAEHGANSLFLCARNEKRLNDVAERCRTFGAKVYTNILDVTNRDEVENWLESCNNKSLLNIVYANAGVSTGEENVENTYNTFNINYQDYDKIEDILSNLLLSSTTISEESTS